MSRAGTIQGEFGWSNSPLIQGMREAEQVTTRGARNIESKFTDIFKRSKNMRAERAFQGFFQSIATGDVAGGIESITHRMTGLGLAAGVAMGAGVAVFMKFRDEAKEADAAVEKIRDHLATPMKMASVEGIKQDFSESLANVKGVEKASKGWGARIRQAFRDEGKDGFLNSGREREYAGNPQLKAANDERDRAGQNAMNLAGLEERIVEARRIGLEVGTKEGQIADLRQKTAEKLEKNAGEFGPEKVGTNILAFKGMQASINKDSKLTEDSIDKQADARERNLALEEKMASLVKGGLKGEDQKKVRTNLELQSLDAQLANEKNPETRRNLLLQKSQKENELRGMGTPDAVNKFAAGTIASRDWEDAQGGFGSIAARSKETDNANSFGSLGYNAAQRGESELPKAGSESAAVVAALNDVKATIKDSMKEYWGPK